MTDLINAAPLDALPLPASPWRYSRRFLDALVAAAAMHAAQPRKGSAVPYASHVLGACSIALDYGASEEEAIAALLHDVIEDVVPPTAAR
jgi:(p)ppGpp synthase/HD superfamily hydrolase